MRRNKRQRNRPLNWPDFFDDASRRASGGAQLWRQEVTRDQARRWLLQVSADKQRTLSEAHYKHFITDMNAGNWQPRVAEVNFDTRWNLMNGQHVLTALIHSNLEKVMLKVSIGHEPEEFAGFDKNRKRSAGDDLKVKGVDKPNEVAAVARALWQYEKGFFSGNKWTSARSSNVWPTAAETCESVEKHPGIQKHLCKLPAFRGSGISISAFRAASYVLEQIDQKQAEKFMRSLVEGIEIPSRDHPIAVLRAYFQSLKNERLRNG